MEQIRITAGPQRIGTVCENIYGGFVEHLGRNVYGGVYDPADPTADENGFRQDVIDCIQDLNMPVTRYPGGCYTDVWRWEDGVGPAENRKTRLDPAWFQKESNQFGLDEFVRWCRKTGTEPVITINLSTRGILEAQDLWEYCNFPGGTTLSDMRIANGSPEPHNIKYWCLGNEQYGGWEFGQKSAEQYGWIARETAKLIKAHDPDAKLIVCGNYHQYDPAWNRTVLEKCAKFVDYISLHPLFNARQPGYLHVQDGLEYEIRTAAALCEEMRIKYNLKHEIKVSVDEWIIWDLGRRLVPEEKWTVGPHIMEQDYTILETVITGGLFSLYHNHCNAVTLACIAQSVNVIAPIRTEKNGVLWKQSIYDPFRYNSRYGRGEALVCRTTTAAAADLITSCVWNEEKRELAFFLTNRGNEAVRVECSFDCIGGRAEIAEAVTMFSDDPALTNSAAAEPLRAKPIKSVTLTPDNRIRAELHGLSWSAVILRLKP